MISPQSDPRGRGRAEESDRRRRRRKGIDQVLPARSVSSIDGTLCCRLIQSKRGRRTQSLVHEDFISSIISHDLIRACLSRARFKLERKLN